MMTKLTLKCCKIKLINVLKGKLLKVNLTPDGFQPLNIKQFLD